MSDDALPLCACEQYYDSHHPECPARRAYEAALLKLDEYEQLLATAYQLAGLVGAPVRFLDAYALHDGTDADSLLPVGLDELEEFKALASRLGAVEDELRHSVSVMSIVRSWLLENVRGSTHWENCEREHATCRAISQLGGVVERLSRLNLTAGGVERTVTNEETQ